MEETRDKGNREEGKLEKEREREEMIKEEDQEKVKEDSPPPHLQTQHVSKTQFST